MADCKFEIESGIVINYEILSFTPIQGQTFDEPGFEAEYEVDYVMNVDLSKAKTRDEVLELMGAYNCVLLSTSEEKIHTMIINHHQNNTNNIH